MAVVNQIMKTNFMGTFLFCREAARLMQPRRYGRIVNFATVAVPLKLEGEAVYAASKAAVISLTQILAREFADFGVTVNAIGPTPIRTDLIRGVPPKKLDALIERQAIKRYGEPRDVIQVIDFFVQPASDFVTGQVIFLGGV
jgi:3-oxoacyl-[acyl-carrier protein] reductase